jgi:hypothetical protein
MRLVERIIQHTFSSSEVSRSSKSEDESESSEDDIAFDIICFYLFKLF